MTLNLALNSAISGLLTAQKGLDTVSHNVANVNTEGYSRKIFTPESRVLGGVGAGVQVGEIQRRVDEGLRADLREATSLSSQYSAAQTLYERIQDLFGQPGDNTTISHAISELGEEINTLSVESHQPGQKDQVVSTAMELASKLNMMSSQLQSLRAEADAQVSANINLVNGYLTDIQALNEKITLASATGNGVSDLTDKRDQVLLKLSEIMDVKHFVRDSGAATVYTASGITLVDSTAKSLSHTANNSPQPWDTVGNGGIDGIWSGSDDVTKDIRSGSLHGLIDMRDNELVNLQAQIDELAGALKDTLNTVHNRGSSYPTLTTDATGSRTFISGAQEFTMSDGEVIVTICDAEGKQTASASLTDIMNTDWTAGGTYDAATGAGAANANGPWTITELSNQMTGFLSATAGAGLSGATAALDSNNNFAINLGNSSYGVAFRDQTSSAGGATVSDATIDFDMNADGTSDREISGFSNFLGLNDFMTTGSTNWQWDSPVHAGTYSLPSSVTMKFSTATDGIDIGTVVFQGGSSLQDIADRINAKTSLDGKITAKVVDEGNGQRLRISTDDGSELAICQTNGLASSFEDLGLAPSRAGSSASLAVSTPLREDPSRVSSGIMQYDANTGEYYLSDGDNTNANAMAEAFTTTQTYNTSGGLSSSDLRLADYAANIVSAASSRAFSNEATLEYQTGLTEALGLKDAETSDVNLDEELAQLMIFEQSYAAAAKIISATQQMFDVLNGIIR